MTLVLHEHPFAAYCWKVLIAFYDRDVPFERVNIGSDEDRARLTELWPTATSLCSSTTDSCWARRA